MSRAVAARSVIGNSKWASIAVSLFLKMVSDFVSALTVFEFGERPILPWFVKIAMAYLIA